MSRRRARAHGDGGQASVEVALLLPLLVVLLLVILQIGLLGRDVVLVTHASREAARAAAVDPDPGAAVAAARAVGRARRRRLTVAVTGRRGRRLAGRGHGDLPRRAPRCRWSARLLGDRTIRSSTTMRVEGPA